MFSVALVDKTTWLPPPANAVVATATWQGYEVKLVQMPAEAPNKPTKIMYVYPFGEKKSKELVQIDGFGEIFDTILNSIQELKFKK